jgi:predicted GNAT family acetyltransferase
MEVVRHKTAAEFLDRAGAWLESAEAENNLILGIAAYFRSYIGQLNVTPYFLTLDDNGTMVGAALMSPPRQLLISDMPDPAVYTLADYMLAESAPVHGLVGRNYKAQLFAYYWTKRTGISSRIRMMERLYACTAGPTLTCASGRLRAATADDQARLSEWCVQFCIDGRIETEIVFFKARLPHKIADSTLFVWETEEVVSMAAIERESRCGAALSWVFTPAHLRRQGYATSCVAALTQRMLDSGKKFCCLYTDLANPTSNSIYQKLGYQPVCDVQDWILV